MDPCCGTFKALVFGIGTFFFIKWQTTRGKEEEADSAAVGSALTGYIRRQNQGSPAKGSSARINIPS
ncbi:MAG TPA: hypothetical protein VGF12_14045 [Roseateles sp.]|uniref:hypothetical protein n=1 Tax=Roseateles sp. TaxID=1971397 RepID=UPI002ED8A324